MISKWYHLAIHFQQIISLIIYEYAEYHWPSISTCGVLSIRKTNYLLLLSDDYLLIR